MHSPRLNGMQGAGANLKANGLRMPTVSPFYVFLPFSSSAKQRTVSFTPVLCAEAFASAQQHELVAHVLTAWPALVWRTAVACCAVASSAAARTHGSPCACFFLCCCPAGDAA